MLPRPERNQQGHAANDRVDAVRYAVLQRIAPAMRHHMVANLQPIAMIYELMEHRMAHERGDLLALQEGVSRIGRFAKAALSSCIETATWLERDAGVMVGVAQGVAECVDMLSRTFDFMGFKIVNEVADGDGRVPRDAIRHSLTAALLAAVDAAEVPSDVVLRSSHSGHGLTISVGVLAAPQSGRTLQAFEEGCRRLTWDDVQAVAGAEAVGFVRQSEGASLFFAL